MADGLTFEFPAADARKLQAEIMRKHDKLGTSLKGSVKWGAIKVAASLGAATKQSKKLRPIVKNPSKKALTDARMAPYGVMKYYKGKKVFSPIRGTGEFGKIRFLNKKTNRMMVRDRTTGEVSYELFTAGKGEFDMPGLMQSKKRIIGRSGLAKKSWTKVSRAIGFGGAVRVGRVRAADTAWSGGKVNPTVTITNHLRYIIPAMRGGKQTVESALRRAADGMETQIKKNLWKKFIK